MQNHQFENSNIKKRYELHDIASLILSDPTFANDQEKALLLKNQVPRTAKCHKMPILKPGQRLQSFEGVPVRKHISGAANFGGLLACGSVWACPICSAKISQVRCEEIANAFSHWRDKSPDNSQIMITFTIPHYADQSISDLRYIFMKARRLLKQQKELKKTPLKVFSQISKEYGFCGSISGIEVTYGYNGWHPHSHDIYFVDSNLSDDQLSQLKMDLTAAWIYACKRAKLEIKNESHMYERSVQIDHAKSAAEYIAKYGKVDFDAHKDILNPSWGPAQEITKSHIKTTKGGKGYTPWDFLRVIAANKDDRVLYLKFGNLFREYTREFHGKRQLFWSKGFKQELGIESMTDEEIAELQDDENTIEVGFIPAEMWLALIHLNLRAYALYLARETDFTPDGAFKQYLDKINERISYEKKQKEKSKEAKARRFSKVA